MRYSVRYSIRFKLFAAMVSLILFFVVLSWILNSSLLEKYYYFSKQNTLLESYKTIEGLYNGDSEKLLLQLEKLENSKGLRIVILDKDFNTLYNSRPGGPGLGIRQNRRGFILSSPVELQIKERLEQILKGEPFIVKNKDDRLNINYINLFSKINKEDFIFISTPVSAIQESVGIANQFFVFTGLVTLLIGSVLIFLVTSRFTRPILELDNIAQRMSTLDFSRRYPVKTRDEIGRLGNSINSLSEQLQKSISELVEANAKLKEDIERERKIDEMRKEFVTNVSHELKTPIALVQGYAEGLKVNVNDDDESRNYYCDVITDEALKMNRLVRLLLDLSQLESGEISLDKTDFGISELVECVLKRNSIIFKEKNINVDVEKYEDITVNADFERMEQVLMNYLNNAVNHVDSNRLIGITVKQVGKKARVTVYNSGLHIPEDSIDKIWTSFYKVDKARTRAYGGTGLGLSIVRAIQQAHNNCCGFSNTEGGVEFWFEMDVVE